MILLLLICFKLFNYIQNKNYFCSNDSAAVTLWILNILSNTNYMIMSSSEEDEQIIYELYKMSSVFFQKKTPGP